MNPHILLVAYLALSVFHIALELGRSQTGRYITKPLLIPVLLAWYLLAAENPSTIVAVALVLGWIGDGVLMLPDEKKRKLTWGLASFLAGHVAYVVAFILVAEGQFGFRGNGVLFIGLFVILAVYAARRVVPLAGKLKAPISVYIAVLLFMGVASILPLSSQAPLPSLLGIFGALTFMTSDLLLGISLFGKNSIWSQALVMATYTAAQGLIAGAFVLYV